MRALIVLAVAGCYSSTTPERCTITCVDPSDCPGGLRCDQGLCTDETSCGASPDGPTANPCKLDRFDTLDWTGTGAGDVTADHGVLRLRLGPSSGTIDATATRAGMIDLTTTDLLFEVVQTPENGRTATTAALTVRLTTSSMDTLELTIGNGGVSVSIKGLASNAAQYKRDTMRHIRLHYAASTSMLVIDSSFDRVEWQQVKSMTINLDMTQLELAVVIADDASTIDRVAELDNIELVTGGCTQAKPTQVARDRFENGVVNETMFGEQPEAGSPWANDGMAQIGYRDQDVHLLGVDIGRAFVPLTGSLVDLDVEADVTWIDFATSHAGVMLRDDSGGVYFDLVADMGVGKFVPEIGTFTSTAENPAASACTADTRDALVNTTHRIRLRNRGGMLTGYLDGVVTCTLTMPLDTVEPGIHFRPNNTLAVDNFVAIDPQL